MPGRRKTGLVQSLRELNSASTAPRNDAEERLKKLELQAEEIDASLDRLAARQDAEYEKWKKHAHTRRYRLPKAECLFKVEFELA